MLQIPRRMSAWIPNSFRMVPLQSLVVAQNHATSKSPSMAHNILYLFIAILWCHFCSSWIFNPTTQHNEKYRCRPYMASVPHKSNLTKWVRRKVINYNLKLRLPELVRSAFQLNLTSLLNQNLSRLFLKLLVLWDVITESKRLFHVWITLLEKKYLQRL